MVFSIRSVVTLPYSLGFAEAGVLGVLAARRMIDVLHIRPPLYQYPCGSKNEQNERASDGSKFSQVSAVF